MLHDCGKITTPVHVVDKATKLETIFDRIHLVASRIDVAKLQAEVDALRRKLAGGDGLVIDSELATQLAAFDDDIKFLRFANVGGERMADADIQRVRDIAKKSWIRPDGQVEPLLTEDEIMNLTIPYGTLNKGERDIINNHIVTTIRMLEGLPWPPHLRNVPEYAGGHHERMDGKGYPRGLTRDQMSLQARVMGIADIFEALTAADRPYKTGKTLSESLQILGRMAQTGHVDPDLFDVFVRRKVYLGYAKRYLTAQQIDAIDESKIPGYVA